MTRLLLALVLLALVALPVQAQSPLADCLPSAAVYTQGYDVLPLGVVEGIRAVPVLGDAVANYAVTPSRWDYPRGIDLGLIWRWQDVVRVDFQDGGPRADAYLLTGDTNRDGIVVVGLFLRPTDGTHNWHGRCAYLVDATALPIGATP